MDENYLSSLSANMSGNGLLASGSDGTDWADRIDRRDAPFLDKNICYPLQRAPYISPSPNMSFESKRIMRQAQDPNSTSRISHYLYEVKLKNAQLISPLLVLCCPINLYLISIVILMKLCSSRASKSSKRSWRLNARPAPRPRSNVPTWRVKSKS